MAWNSGVSAWKSYAVLLLYLGWQIVSRGLPELQDHELTSQLALVALVPSRDQNPCKGGS